MIVRNLRKAAYVMLLSIVVLYGTACQRSEEDSFSAAEYDPEEGREEEKPGDRESGKEEASGKTGGSGKEGTKATIYVYVCGAVNSPGVYELKEDARLFEAVSCAGGIRDDGAEEAVNQAQRLSDGEQVYIPTDAEVEEGSFTSGSSSAGDSGKGNPQGSGLVNLNTASKEELKTLSGIGDTRADSILAYREANGGFSRIEDLMLVDGIKEGLYEKIKDSITV